MRESIGSVFLYNMIFLFIIIVFGVLSATISYYKAFKVNERLLYSIDKFEGYNRLSQIEMENYLSSIGYTSEGKGVQSACASERDGATLIRSNSSTHLYCVYYFSDDRSNAEKKEDKKNKDGSPIYINYALVSYIYVELPIVGNFKVPVYTKGERVYNFSDNQEQGVVS